MSSSIKNTLFELTLAAAVTVLLGYTLLARPVVGMANNGDFERAMEWAGVRYPDSLVTWQDRDFAYIHLKFAYAPPITIGALRGLSGFAATAPGVLAVRLARAAGQTREWDIRWLAAVDLTVFLLGVYLILRATRRWPRLARLMLLALITLVWGDIGYTAFLNSFFSEGASLVYFTLFMGLAVVWSVRLSQAPSAWWVRLPVFAAITVVAVLLTQARAQNLPLMVPLALMGACWLWLLCRPWERVVGGALLAAALAAAAYSLTHYSPVLRLMNTHDSLFCGILDGSPDPAADLREMGVAPRFAKYDGKCFFLPDVDSHDPTYLHDMAGVTHGAILRFYLHHPGRLLHVMEHSAQDSITLHLDWLGNFTSDTGLPERRGAAHLTFSTMPGPLAKRACLAMFTSWQRLRLRLFPGHAAFIAGFLGLNVLGGIVVLLRRSARTGARLWGALHAGLALMCTLSALAAILGDGRWDLRKHLFFFNLTFDTVLLSLAACVLDGLAHRGERPALQPQQALGGSKRPI